MAYITKSSQLQDLQSINVFLQVRGIKMFQLVTRFEYVSKMNVVVQRCPQAEKDAILYTIF